MTNRPLEAFDARPNQSLARHLEGVVAGVETLTAGWETTPVDDDWTTVAAALAWTHDFGKLTSWFQTYLETGDRSDAPSVSHTYHGEVSAFVTLTVLQTMDCAPETVAAGFIAVSKHHSDLPDLHSEFERYSQATTEEKRRRFDVLADQIADIDSNAPAAANRILQQATGGSLSWSDINDTSIEKYVRFLEELRTTLFSGGATSSKHFYEYTLSLWSMLVTADKSDASGLTQPGSTENLQSERPDYLQLTQTVDRLASTTLPNGNESRWYRKHPDAALPGKDGSTAQRVAAIQTIANERATRTIQNNPNQQVFELTLPTGFGKTFSGLRAAMTRAHTRDSRVIYALPYTSIIDQVDNDIQNVFDVEPHSKLYTKHHHLADTRTDTRQLNTETYSNGHETLHAEAWRAGVVLTTFTQLFESLAGPANTQSMKLPALHNSVIIIDEPQAAPLKWWNLIGRLIGGCVDLYDATVIVMTATQPRFLDHLDMCPTPHPLADLSEEYTAVLDESPRVAFQLHESLTGHLDGGRPPLDLETAAAELEAATPHDTDTLTIVNTVECAVTISKTLAGGTTVELGEHLLSYRQSVDPNTQSPVGYLQYLAERTTNRNLLTAALTTRLRPTDRRLLINALSLILDAETTTPFDDCPTITVSTQLIEAGVDVSFDRLFRDFAPLPAIVQAAGRCNRSFGGSTRTVTLWRLDSPVGSDYVPSILIYGDDSLLMPTRSVLESLRGQQDTDRIPEATLIGSGIESFYRTLHRQRKTASVNDELVTAFDSGNGEKLRHASLIAEEYATLDVAVLVTDSEQQHYRKYKNAKRQERWQEATEQFQALQSCITAIPVSEASDDDKLRSLAPVSQADGYDVTTGQGVEIDSVVFDTEV